MMKNKAQGGMNAAILVAIVAGLIILYIIFLPTAEKEKLITDKTSKQSEAKSEALLRVSPGMLSTLQDLEDEKTIPNIFLVETTNAKVLEQINPFIVRNGVFDKKTKRIDFELEDPDNTDNVILSFIVKKRKGTLTITLNGAAIFENELTSDIIEPVKLNRRSLGKTNTLEFSVSSVGFKFWTTNEYSIDNIKIIGDITDTSKQESTNIFTISESELSSMNRVELKFIPYCSNVNEVGTLDIFINNKKLFSSVPPCDDRPYSQSVPKNVLNNGENNIVFKTSKGSYSIEQIRISLEFKEPKVKTYYFEINESLFKKIRDGDADLMLTIKFVDDGKEKTAKLYINSHVETLETRKAMYSKNINSLVSDGNNLIRLEPLEDLEVVELKVELT